MKSLMNLKKATFFLLIGVFSSTNTFGSGQVMNANNNAENVKLRSVAQSAFQSGEHLKYVLHYGVMNAGIAELNVSKCDKKVKGRSLLHMEAIGRTISAFDWFFKVRDRYETYIDEQGVFPWIFVRRVNEGGYEINQDYTFYQHKKIVKTEEGKATKVPLSVQDMLSSFYYARTIDFSDAKIDQEYSFDCYMDGEIYPVKIRYKGKETINTRLGKIKCMMFVPIVQSGRIFQDEDDLHVWISDDENKIPILAQANVLVGTIKMELFDYGGLGHDLIFE